MTKTALIGTVALRKHISPKISLQDGNTKLSTNETMLVACMGKPGVFMAFELCRAPNGLSLNVLIQLDSWFHANKHTNRQTHEQIDRQLFSAMAATQLAASRPIYLGSNLLWRAALNRFGVTKASCQSLMRALESRLSLQQPTWLAANEQHTICI